MLTIGIDLNHVVRNINKQILKYYAKEYDPSLDYEEIDDRQDVLKDVVHFESSYYKWKFFYEDYPYEIFGCASPMDKRLPQMITTWLADITNIEDEDIRIVFFSLDEGELSIQSTYFFLSKIGARVRKVFFPKEDSEVWDECDVVVTARKELLGAKVPNGKKIVKIERPFNEGVGDDAFLSYKDLGDIIADGEFFGKLIGNKEKDGQEE